MELFSRDKNVTAGACLPVLVMLFLTSFTASARALTAGPDTLRASINFNKADSLRKAKLELMTHSVYTAPLYWAPFILLGK